MSPDFALATDPVFLHVIDLLERINRNEAREPGAEREGIENSLRDAEARLGDKKDWQLAKYAIVAWIDEVLKQADWDGRKWWTENSLEFAFFATNDASVEFYRKAKEAAGLSRRDALEVYYVCVVLGFRGLYNFDDRLFLTEQLQLPPDVESWASRTARSIKYGLGRPDMEIDPQPIRGAPPLSGRYRLVATSLATVVLLCFVLLFGWWWWGKPRDPSSDSFSMTPHSGMTPETNGVATLEPEALTRFVGLTMMRETATFDAITCLAAGAFEPVMDRERSTRVVFLAIRNSAGVD